MWFADAELASLRQRPAPDTAVGPFGSAAPLESVAALRAVVSDPRPAPLARRAHFIVRLSECSLAWTEAGNAERRRLLVIEGGEIAGRAELEPLAPLPVPPGCARSTADRRARFDLARYDRLRVLTTELRALAAGAASVELRLGLHARLCQARLRRVLRWL